LHARGNCTGADFQLSSIFGYRGDDSGKLLQSLGLFRRFQQRRCAGAELLE
jgi:hypothetical protein